jgi:hypothetical protein
VVTVAEPGPRPATTPVCRGCGAPGIHRVVDLGPQPACDSFPPADAPEPDPAWPLELWSCPTCALVQLGPITALLEEPVLAVESETSRRHARRLVAAVLADHPWLAGRPVREFASHHGGSWLPALAEHGCPEAAAGEPADLVVDAHALAHEEDAGRALAERAAALAPTGLLVLEHHHLLPLVEQGQFDTVRHGHWTYLSLTAVDRLARRHGLQAVQAVTEPVYGGSLRVVLALEGSRPVDASVDAVLAAERDAGLSGDARGLVSFEDRARVAARTLRSFLVAERAAGRRVLGYGAPSKAAVLLGVAGIGRDLLEFTVDASPLKHGLAVPGGRVPIRSVPDLVAARPDVVLVLTWDIADEVMDLLEASGGWGARYVLPLLHEGTPRTVVPRVSPGVAG